MHRSISRSTEFSKFVDSVYDGKDIAVNFYIISLVHYIKRKHIRFVGINYKMYQKKIKIFMK